MIDHSSDSWFSTGVPVSATRDAAGSARTACACPVAWFLIACDYSQIPDTKTMVQWIYER
jgi:hypothetical protein